MISWRLTRYFHWFFSRDIDEKNHLSIHGLSTSVSHRKYLWNERERNRTKYYWYHTTLHLHRHRIDTRHRVDVYCLPQQIEFPVRYQLLVATRVACFLCPPTLWKGPICTSGIVDVNTLTRIYSASIFPPNSYGSKFRRTQILYSCQFPHISTRFNTLSLILMLTHNHILLLGLNKWRGSDEGQDRSGTETIYLMKWYRNFTTTRTTNYITWIQIRKPHTMIA